MQILEVKNTSRVRYDGRLFKREETYDHTIQKKSVYWFKIEKLSDRVIDTPVGVMESYSEDILESKFQKLNHETN